MLVDNEVAQPIYAPADIIITQARSGRSVADGTIDYTLIFFPCSEVWGYYNHMTTLTDELLEEIGEFSNCEIHDPGGGANIGCSKEVTIPVAAGTLLGYAGGPTHTTSVALDFGLRDIRVPEIYYVNPDRLTSVGNSDLGSEGYYFDFTSSGLIRRAFSDITAGGNIYCFDELRDMADRPQGRPISGYLFLEMASNTTLVLERVTSGSCPANPNTLSFTATAVNFER